MTETDRRQKPQIVVDIAWLLGASPPPSANGAREPKQILVIVNDRLGLGFDNDLNKPDLARSIVQSAGLTWTPDCWSRPQTLTRNGLLRVEQAVRVFLGPEGSR